MTPRPAPSWSPPVPSPCGERRRPPAHRLGFAAALRRVRECRFDVIHNHIDWLAFPFARLSATPTISTSHGRLDLAPIRNTLGRFSEQALVSISKAQSDYLPNARWLATVHNGIALDHFRFQPEPGDYLVFLGRINPEKRPDRAIEIAGRAGMRLVIAAKVDPVDREYYECEITPLIRRSPWVVYSTLQGRTLRRLTNGEHWRASLRGPTTARVAWLGDRGRGAPGAVLRGLSG